MDIIETAQACLDLYNKGTESSLKVAMPILSSLHVEVYEATSVARDMTQPVAHDLYQLIQHDFPYWTDALSAEPDSRLRRSFCSTAKSIGELLSDYLMD